MEAVEDLLSHLAAGGTLVGTDAPRLIMLTCYHVLAQAGDLRAAEVLASAHTGLQTLADAILDATLRHSFLNSIPEHREIVVAWTVHQTESAGGQAAVQGERSANDRSC